METLVICLGLIAIVTAGGVISLKNPVYCAVSLIGHMITLATIFILLNAEFLAMVQVIVYAGAVVVLFLFIIAFLGTSGSEEVNKVTVDRKVILILSVILVLEILCMLTLPEKDLIKTAYMGQENSLPFGSIELLSHELFSRFLIPFELASVLLLIAAVGILALVRRSKKHNEMIKEVND
ncbi:MAG: NADH-quinone oxidoreductase subunit J [Nitrospinae bacterium]|nr:NADH-quinone oxidoreductase subunit J [Nitrospinota bacterium]